MKIVVVVLLVLCIGTAAALSVADVAPEGFTFVAPEDTSHSAALLSLGDARAVVEDMQALHFGVKFMSDALAEAEDAFEQEDYMRVFKLAQLIQYIHDDSVYFMDTMKLMEGKVTVMERDGAEMVGVHALMSEAMGAFEKEQFDEAHVMMGEADVAMKQAEADFRRATLIKKFSRNFLLRYWWQIIVVLVVIGVVSVPAVKKFRRALLRRRVEKVREELRHAQELIKRLQHQCFVEKRVTTETYKKNAERYEDKIAEIKHTLPVLEAQLKGD